MGYTGKQPSAVPLTTADLIDGSITSADIADLDAAKLTGTVNNARISLDAAEIPNLDTAKVTSGTFASARISEASVTQHVTATDLTPVRQDIAMLALYNAVSDNRAAYNLPNSFIDQFEDDTGLTTQTTVDRVDGYVASVYTALGTPVYITSDRSSSTPSITATKSGWSYASGTIQAMVDGSVGNAFYFSAGTPSAGAYIRFQYSVATLVTEAKWHTDSSPQSYGVWKWQGSQNGSSWTDIGSSFTLVNATNPQIQTSLNSNTTAYVYYQLLYQSGSVVSTNWHYQIEFKEAPVSSNANATGTLISDTQTATSATTKMSGVIIYKDNAGTATLGTDLVISLSANGGTNWTEAASYGAVTPLFSTGVKMVRLGETTVTSGTAPVIKAVWANQASSSKETQLHGWAMNY